MMSDEDKVGGKHVLQRKDSQNAAVLVVYTYLFALMTDSSI